MARDVRLESRGTDELRLARLDEVLRDPRAYEPVRQAILAGDMNLDK
jgi:hypothetical protein